MSVLIGSLIAILTVIAIIAAALAVFTLRIAAKVRAGFPPTGQFTDVPGGRIHWVEAGKGRPLVFIHGLSGNLANFTYALTGALADEFRVIALDRPGSGHSERGSHALASLWPQADQIAAFLEAEKIEDPVIAGHSLGGAISLALAIRHPERVGALALLAPLARTIEDAPPPFAAMNIASPSLRWLVSRTLAPPLGVRSGPKTLSAVFAPETPPADFGVKGGGLLGLRPDAFYAASSDLRASLEMDAVRARYGEIRCPAGVLYGMEDAVLETEAHLAALQAGIPHIHIERLQGVGHMPIVTQVDATAAFIRRFSG